MRESPRIVGADAVSPFRSGEGTNLAVGNLGCRGRTKIALPNRSVGSRRQAQIGQIAGTALVILTLLLGTTAAAIEASPPNLTLGEGGRETITLEFPADAEGKIITFVEVITNPRIPVAAFGEDYTFDPAPDCSHGCFYRVPPNERSLTITVGARRDTEVEGLETIDLNFVDTSDSEAPPAIVKLAIEDVVLPAVSISDATATEGSTGVTNLAFTVTLSDPAPSGGVSVRYDTSNNSAIAGSDYTETSDTLTIPQGTSSATIDVPIIGDRVVEPLTAETFALTLSSPTNATIADGTATGTINENDVLAGTEISIVASDASASESGPDPGRFTINRNGDSPGKTVIVQVQLSGGATPGTDYGLSVAGTTTSTDPSHTYFLDDGVATLDVDLTPRIDSETEGAETATMTAVASGSSASITIADSTPAPSVSVTIANASIDEGNSGTTNLSFTVSLSAAASQPITVQYATADGSATADSDYTAANDPLTIPAGQTSATITVPVVGDAVSEPDETFTVTLSNPTNAALGTPSTGSGLIRNDDAATIVGGSRTIADSDSEPGVTAEFSATNLGSVEPASLLWTVTAGSEVVDTAEGSATATLDLRSGENRVQLAARIASDSTSLLAEISVQVGEPGQFSPLLSELSPEDQEVARGTVQTCSNLQTSDPGALTDGQQDLLATCNALLAAAEGGEVDTVETALDQISGRQLTTTQTLGTDFSAAQLTNIGARLEALRQGSRGFSVSGLQMQGVGDGVPWRELYAFAKDLLGPGGGSGDEPDELMDGPLGIFLNGNVRFGDKDGTENESGFDFDSQGITLGADYRFTDNLVLGAAVGYAEADSDFDNDGGTLDSDSLTASAFGTWYGPKFYLDWIGSYGMADHDSVRNINISGLDITDVARGTTDGTQWALGLGGGYTFNKGAWNGGPNLAVSYVKVDVDAFTEQTEGDSGLAMIYPDQDGESLTVQAGGRLGYSFSVPWGVLMPQVRGDFVREFENDQQAITVRFANDVVVGPPGSPTTGFVVFTDNPDEYYFLWGASLIAQFGRGISGFIDYEQTEGLDNITSGEFSFGLRIQTRF